MEDEDVSLNVIPRNKHLDLRSFTKMTLLRKSLLMKCDIFIKKREKSRLNFNYFKVQSKNMVKEFEALKQ